MFLFFIKLCFYSVLFSFQLFDFLCLILVCIFIWNMTIFVGHSLFGVLLYIIERQVFITHNLNINVKPMKGLALKFSAHNITDEKRSDFIGNESTFMDYVDRCRTYLITANYRF